MRATLLIALMLALSAGAWADIYKYRDPTGQIMLSDRRMGAGYVLLQHIRAPKPASASRGLPRVSLSKRRARYDPMIRKVARETRLEPKLIHAVVQAESAYNPHALSKKGALGLMQLMPATARRYGVTDRRDPKQNLRGGSRYLRDLLKRFNNDVVLALAAYNAGENAVDQYGRRIPPYAETRGYVDKILAILAASQS